MKMMHYLCFTVLALTFVSTGVHAKAETLLFENTPSGSGGIASFIGFGQELIVTTTTDLTGIAFDLSATTATTGEYMIWNGDNSQLLYTSSAVSIAASSTKSWIEAPVTYTLDAGSTYFIAVLTSGNASLANGGASDVDTGFTAVADNGDYKNFASPQFFGNGSGNIAVQLYGTQTASVTPSAVPEPGSIALLATGMLGLAGTIRRRWMC